MLYRSSNVIKNVLQILVFFLVLGIMLVLSFIITSLLTQNYDNDKQDNIDNIEQVTRLTYDETIQSLGVSDDVEDTLTDFHQSFWVHADDIKSLDILFTKSEDVLARNSTKATLTEQELRDEYLVLTNYAAAGLMTYPATGLQTFARIYNNDAYPGWVRANAILHAMYFPWEKLDDDNSITISEANDWIFAPDRFGNLIEGTEYEDTFLDSNRDIFDASIVGLQKAEEIAAHEAMRLKIASTRLDMEIHLMIEDLLVSKGATWKDLHEQNFTLSELTPILDKISELDAQQEALSRKFLGLDRYDNRLPHAAKNLMRINANLLSLGLSRNDYIQELHQESAAYQDYFFEDGIVNEAKQIRSYLAVNFAYLACANIINNDYDLENPSVLESTNDLISGFTDLSPAEQRIMIVGAKIGMRESTACYYPFVLLGRKNQEFKTDLIENVGNWTESQFD